MFVVINHRPASVCDSTMSSSIVAESSGFANLNSFRFIISTSSAIFTLNTCFVDVSV